MDGAKTVSYTHLDVYKRQVLWLTENTGGLELYKESENPSVTEGNAAYLSLIHI